MIERELGAVLRASQAEIDLVLEGRGHTVAIEIQRSL